MQPVANLFMSGASLQPQRKFEVQKWPKYRSDGTRSLLNIYTHPVRPTCINAQTELSMFSQYLIVFDGDSEVFSKVNPLRTNLVIATFDREPWRRSDIFLQRGHRAS